MIFWIVREVKKVKEVEEVQEVLKWSQVPEHVTVGNFDFSPWGESKLPKVQTGHFPRTDFQNFWHEVRPR